MIEAKIISEFVGRDGKRHRPRTEPYIAEPLEFQKLEKAGCLRLFAKIEQVIQPEELISPAKKKKGKK